MSNLSEAAAESGEKVGEAVDEIANSHPSTSGALPAGGYRTPFDFRLKLDLGGARSAERGMPLFEPRVEARVSPVFVPTVVVEPVAVEPIPFSLDLLLAPEPVPDEPHTPIQQGAVATPEVVHTDFESSGSQFLTAEYEPSLPSLPRVTARVISAAAPVADQRAAAPTAKVMAERQGQTTNKHARKRRGKAKPFMAFIVVLGLIAGGSFYVLKQREEARGRVKEWPAELKSLAAFVEQTLGHPFEKSVPVTVLPQAEYEAKLGIYELARVPKDTAGGFSGLRALGLIDSAPTAAQVGQYVGATNSAFYDPDTATVYETEGVTGSFHDANLISALSVALFDQYKTWGAAMASLSPSQQLGYLSLIEAAGTYTSAKKSELDPAFASAFTSELADRTARRDASPTTLSPWLIGLFDIRVANSRGITTRALNGDFFDGINVPVSDALVLDSSRGLDTPVGAATAEPSTAGMYFWYGLLYPAVGSDFSFHMASTWSSDSVAYTIADGRGCVRASVATTNAATQAELVNGLKAWAKTRPVTTGTTVDSSGTSAVVTACEPSDPVTLDAASHVKRDFQRRLETEQVLLQQLNALAMPLTNPSIACAVNAYRAFGVVGFEQEVDSLLADSQAFVSVELGKSLQDLANSCRAAE